MELVYKKAVELSFSVKDNKRFLKNGVVRLLLSKLQTTLLRCLMVIVIWTCIF
jgi:hypothetical protein